MILKTLLFLPFVSASSRCAVRTGFGCATCRFSLLMSCCFLREGVFGICELDVVCFLFLSTFVRELLFCAVVRVPSPLVWSLLELFLSRDNFFPPHYPKRFVIRLSFQALPSSNISRVRSWHLSSVEFLLPGSCPMLFLQEHVRRRRSLLWRLRLDLCPLFSLGASGSCTRAQQRVWMRTPLVLNRSHQLGFLVLPAWKLDARVCTEMAAPVSTGWLNALRWAALSLFFRR